MKKLILIISILLFGTVQAADFTTTYSENGKFGLIKNNTKITEAKYSKLIRLRDTSHLFMYKNKYGIISNDGVILIEPKYTQAQRYLGKYVKLGSKNKFAIFDEEGKQIITQEYSSIEILYGKMFLVQKNFKYGLIKFNGDIILAPIADDIYMPTPYTLKICYDGEWYEIEKQSKGDFELPTNIMSLGEEGDFKITQIVQKPIASAGYGVVTTGDFFIKIFSSISPSYEETIDQLILNHGADTATILIKSGWIVKFPFVYVKNYINNIKSPNNGPLSDIKNDLKNKIK